MYYELQPLNQREAYKRLLELTGSLSRMYSNNEAPYLYYRAHESIFSRCFEAEDLGREDSSADALKDGIGYGLKTWIGRDDQKVAEFGRVRSEFARLEGLELARTIAKHRNNRIRITKNLHNITNMIYHIVKRVPGAMEIYEHCFDYIDIDNLQIVQNSRANDNNTYFTDGRHNYHFSKSKCTLYMIFEDLVFVDRFDVNIIEDPFQYLLDYLPSNDIEKPIISSNQEILYGEVKESNWCRVAEAQSPYGVDSATEDIEEVVQQPLKLQDNQICLRLYSIGRGAHAGEPFVPERSGLNQWNAAGRARNADELYIAYQSIDRERNPEFFPPRDVVFQLHLPDGTVVPAKQCQDPGSNDTRNGKAIMSNPNSILGHWLLRQVFELPEKTLVTYQMLGEFGIDSVIFTKNSALDYSVDFCRLGTYEEIYGNG